MKNIKYPLIIFLQLFAFQMVMGQAQTDNNGRHLGTTPQPVKAKEDVNKQGTEELTEIDDADIPGTYYLQGGGVDDVIIENHGPADLLDRLDNMETELSKLRLYNEQLALENQTIKKEMGNCCSEVAANLGSTSSFLLQNSPNPFNEATNIQFFVADQANDAVLEVRDMEGVLIESFNIDQKGLAEVNFDKDTYAKGTYIYTLLVDGQMIDSKVMIQQ